MDRKAELKIWLIFAICTGILLLIGATAKLLGLLIGFAVGLCIRARAKAGAKPLNDGLRQADFQNRTTIFRVWDLQLSDQADHFRSCSTTWLRIFTALRSRVVYKANFGVSLPTSPPDR